MTQNPALTRLTSGERAKPSTLEQLWRDRPELRALYDHHLDSEDLFDMRPVLAQARALSDWIVSRFNPVAPDGENGPPLAFRAIQSLANVVRTAREMIRIEEALGPVTHAEIGRLMNGIALTIQRYVPTDQRGEALKFLRQHVGSAHRGPGQPRRGE